MERHALPDAVASLNTSERYLIIRWEVIRGMKQELTAQSNTTVTFTFPALTGNLFYHCDGN